jgi:transcriptional regulator with XRE-family HTH domain
MSVRELADKAGVSPNTVHLIETGQRIPQFRVIRAVSAALGVDPTAIEEFVAAVRNAADTKSPGPEGPGDPAPLTPATRKA